MVSGNDSAQDDGGGGGAGSCDGAFLTVSAAFLRDTYLPRIERALAVLPPSDLWWRAHDGALATGNLLLHLNGNVTQWICSALGGDTDRRERPLEFAATEGHSVPSLLAALTSTVQRAAQVIEQLPSAGLQRPLVIQGFQTTPFWAIYHVVEHFAWHTGQIVQLAKQRAGAAHGIAFYNDAALAKARNTP